MATHNDDTLMNEEATCYKNNKVVYSYSFLARILQYFSLKIITSSNWFYFTCYIHLYQQFDWTNEKSVFETNGSESKTNQPVYNQIYISQSIGVASISVEKNPDNLIWFRFFIYIYCRVFYHKITCLNLYKTLKTIASQKYSVNLI